MNKPDVKPSYCDQCKAGTASVFKENDLRLSHDARLPVESYNCAICGYAKLIEPAVGYKRDD